MHPPVEKQMTRTGSSQLFGSVKPCALLRCGWTVFDCLLVYKNCFVLCVCVIVLSKRLIFVSDKFARKSATCFLA